MGFLAEAGWCLTSIWLYVAGVLFTVSLVTYLLPFVAAAVLPVRDLKKAYKAEWAIVTGGSSGIGLSLCNKLAAQGLNVVVAALDNDLLPKALKQLKADFPNQEFISVPVDLSKDGYVDQIKEATKGLTIQVRLLPGGPLLPRKQHELLAGCFPQRWIHCHWIFRHVFHRYVRVKQLCAALLLRKMTNSGRDSSALPLPPQALNWLTTTATRPPP